MLLPSTEEVAALFQGRRTERALLGRRKSTVHCAGSAGRFGADPFGDFAGSMDIESFLAPEKLAVPAARLRR